MIFKILEVLFVFLAILIIGSQIVVPALKNRAMFPMFRRQGTLEKELSKKNQEKHERNLETKLNKMGDKK